MNYNIQELMQTSGVKFGTSGARGLVSEMTDLVCYAYTKAFIQYLEQTGELKKAGEPVAIAGDLRPSSERIMTAVARAASDMGYRPVNAGFTPSPAVALYGLEHACPAVMVTGSHIPADRNGIKFNKASGEVLKTDESGITGQTVALSDELFTATGMFASPFALPAEDLAARDSYVARYLNAFPGDCLAGKKIGVYQHSAVGRKLLVEIFEGLGATVTALGFSDTFIPVDTEAIRDEDVVLAKDWSAEHGFDAIISTDGDSDRPLISDESGVWLRGDIAGILAARYLGAQSVSTPISCNTALEKTEWFSDINRTKIGSPFVIASMMQSEANAQQGIIGYEANGGFLTQTDFSVFGNRLTALPTRDAVLPVLSIILLSVKDGKSIGALLNELPACFTASGRIQNFPTEESAKIIAKFTTGDVAKDREALEASFGQAFGAVVDVDRTDGLRVTFDSAEVVHMRPSGNAPEFRCYTEAASQSRVDQISDQAMQILLMLKAG